MMVDIIVSGCGLISEGSVCTLVIGFYKNQPNSSILKKYPETEEFWSELNKKINTKNNTIERHVSKRHEVVSVFNLLLQNE